MSFHQQQNSTGKDTEGKIYGASLKLIRKEKIVVKDCFLFVPKEKRQPQFLIMDLTHLKCTVATSIHLDHSLNPHITFNQAIRYYSHETTTSMINDQITTHLYQVRT